MTLNDYEKSLIGTTLDNRYLIESVLGEGGMSTVYKAKHVFLKKDVAIKVMQQSMSANSESFLRFQREAQAAAVLSHPNIIAVSEFGVAETGEPYMVMDYLEGQPLSELLRENRPQPAESLLIFRQIVSALVHAHEKGILHRDLKPSNVMLHRTLNEALQAKVVDLGLARFLPHTGSDQLRLTAAGQLIGSPYYMSPEQIRDEELDARSDIYSLGCLMYETLTGCRPFDDANTITVLSMHLYDEPPTFSAVMPGCRVPKRLQAMVLKCLDKSRSRRYQTMSELLRDLDAIEVWDENLPASEERTTEKETAGAASQQPNAGGQGPGKRIERTRSGTMDFAGLTLRFDQPNFAQKGFGGALRRMADPILKLTKPTIVRVMGAFEGRGSRARTQKVTGTKVLVAVLGAEKEDAAAAQADADKYKVYYKSVELRKSLSAQEFLVLLATEKFEIVHLHGQYDRGGIFHEASRFGLRLGDIRRACEFAGVKLLWLASSNNPDWLKGSSALTEPSFSVVITQSRGENFPKFLSGFLSRTARGESLNSVWSIYVPYIEYKGYKTECRFLAGQADTIFLP
jgi:serine/threonine protein kinase